MKPRNHVARSQLLRKGGVHQPPLGKQQQKAQRQVTAEIDDWLDNSQEADTQQEIAAAQTSSRDKSAQKQKTE